MPKNVLFICNICAVELSALRMVTLRDAQHKEKFHLGGILEPSPTWGVENHRKDTKLSDCKGIAAGLAWFGV